MIYKQNGNIIEKYEVVLDRERIEKLRISIINDCSYIAHREYRTTIVRGYDKEPLRFRKVRFDRIGWKEFRDGPDEMEYLVSFDEYIFPDVIKLIDRLLKGDESVLEELFKSKESGKNIDELIEKKSKELDNIDNLDIKNKQRVLNELSDLLDKKELNKNQRPIDIYMEDIKKSISISLVDTIDLEMVERVEGFYGRTLKL